MINRKATVKTRLAVKNQLFSKTASSEKVALAKKFICFEKNRQGKYYNNQVTRVISNFISNLYIIGKLIRICTKFHKNYALVKEVLLVINWIEYVVCMLKLWTIAFIWIRNGQKNL